MLTWSFGWTGVLEPIWPPSISIARFEITSLAFMFDWVPDPVCQTTSGKWSSSLPSITSWAAATMTSPILGSSLPRAMLASAAARLTTPSALMIGLGCFSQPILKFCSERWVWAPQYLSAGTSIGPKVSVSVRVALIGLFGLVHASIARGGLAAGPPRRNACDSLPRRRQAIYE